MVVKPGYRTTEFWAAVLASVATWIAQWAGTLPPRYAAYVTALSAAAYAISRAITKHGAATGTAAQPPKSV
jgi:hypothetical protein